MGADSVSTIIPAYGRDYTSMKAAKADFMANKDFVIADLFNPYDGKYVNRSQLGDQDTVQIRFHRLTRCGIAKCR